MAVGMQPRLLERSAEVDELLAGLEAARSGAGRLVVVEGAAGIGKTRLLAAARETAGRTGVRALWARGTELERDFPFALVRQLLEPVVRGLEPGDRRDVLAGAAAAAGPVLGVGDAASGAVDPSFMTLNALYWLTSNLAEPQPLLLAVDDVHWADEPSLRFFHFLRSRLEDLPVLVVFAARPAEPGAQPGLLAQLIADPATRVVRPRELSRPAVAELVRGQLHPEATEEFCDACHYASRGNPFMLHELVGELAAGGSRGSAGEAARVREVAPEAIRRAVLVRLARLPEPASQLARAVAVLGDDVALSDAARLAALERTDAAAAADAVASAGILEPGRPLRFVHPLVRTAVYADMPGAAKGTAHHRAARLLVDDGAEPERIAIHLLATDPDHDAQVVDTLAAAARRGLDRAAPEIAATYLQRALTEPPPDAATRLDLLRLLLRAHFRAGDRQAFEHLVDAGALEEVLADRRLLLESAAEFALALYAWPSMGDMAAVVERATAAATDSGDDELVARLQGLAVFWTNTGPTDALASLDRLEERVEPDSAGERMYLAMRALYTICAGASAGTVVELASRALAGGSVWAENIDTVVPDFAVMALRNAGDLDGAERALAQARALSGSRRSMQYAVEPFHHGEQAFLRGQIAEAEADARVAVELSHQQGYPLANPPWIALLVEVLVERDDLAGADAELARVGLTGPIPGHWWFLGVAFSRARLRLAQGNAAAAVDDLLTFRRLAAETRADPQYIPALSYLALGLLALGDHAEAQQVAAQEVAAARAWGLARKTGIALRALGLVEGGERGLELLRESIDVLESSPARLEHTRSLAEYGAALRRANRRAEAREPLRAALDAARRAGALAIAGRAHDELEATGEKLRPLLGGGVESLTPSERRIADLAAQGHSNREIAQSLFLTVKTVENHLTTAYRKLEIHSRSELPTALG